MRSSNNPKYRHLREELHVEISTFAPPSQAYSRIAHALTEVDREMNIYLVKVKQGNSKIINSNNTNIFNSKGVCRQP